MKKISVVIPCKNEEENIRLVYEELEKVAASLTDCEMEYIYIDDGSTGKTLDLIKELSEEDPKVRYLSFSRNFGKEAAMLAGFRAAQGDYITTIDSDLQDPPSLIPQMVEILESGEYDNVATIRKGRKGEGVFRSFLTRMFYRFSNRISEVRLVNGARDFRLMKREMVEAILAVPESERFLKGIYDWVGFRTYWITFQHADRIKGKSQWSLSSLFRYAVNGLINYTGFPLTLPTFFGVLTGLLGIGLLIAALVIYCLDGTPFLGFMSLFGFISLLFSMIFFCLTVLGKYLHLTFRESQKRPHYIIRECNIDQVDRIG